MTHRPVVDGSHAGMVVVVALEGGQELLLTIVAVACAAAAPHVPQVEIVQAEAVFGVGVFLVRDGVGVLHLDAVGVVVSGWVEAVPRNVQLRGIFL